MRRLLLAATALLGLLPAAASAESGAEPANPATATAAPAGPRYGTWGAVLSDMDRSVKPGDSLFDFAEGSWLRTKQIAADKAAAGFNYELPDEIKGQVRALIEGAAAHPANATERQIGDFYAAYMDEAGIEARGTAPLKPYLAGIAAIDSTSALFAKMLAPGYASPINVFVNIDQDAPTRYVVGVAQGDQGLPTRDFYLLEGEPYTKFRAAYVAYIEKMLTLAGIPDAAGAATRILALETKIAKEQWTPEQRRDPVATHNPMPVAALAKLAPGLDWAAAITGAGFGTPAKVDVAEKSAITAAAQFIAREPLATWKEYLAFRFVSDHAEALPKAFDDARFDFYSRTLSGISEQRARWKRAIDKIDFSLGEAVGQLYVAKYWGAETNRQARELVDDMRAAYADKIRGASWMDEPTRAAALAKLNTFDPRVGHPVKWIDYSTYPVRRDDALANLAESEAFQFRRSLAYLPGPVDRGLWFMTPQTVNAYYQPMMNQITLPAGILQPPFFDAAADPAVNYAMTGATTIGHEMGHGFDDQGRQFDEMGRLRDWWSATTAARYKVKADRLAAQFDTYEPIPGVHIKGRLTLGENLADLGGLETAYAAYRRYVSRHGEQAVIDGFTGDQRFFIAYAQAWQGKRREDSLRQQLLSDPHSPDRYRVDGIVRNFDPFYAAFGVKPGDKLYLPPEERVRLW